MHQLPELMDMNLRLYEKTEQDIATAKKRFARWKNTSTRCKPSCR